MGQFSVRHVHGPCGPSAIECRLGCGRCEHASRRRGTPGVMASLAPGRFGRSGVMPAGAQRRAALRRPLPRCWRNLGDQVGYIELAATGERACVNSKLGLNGQKKELPRIAKQGACHPPLPERLLSCLVEQIRKRVAVRHGSAVLATSVSALPALVERSVCQGGSRSCRQAPVARLFLAPRFAQERRPRPGCDRGDSEWLDQKDRARLQPSSRSSP